MKLSERQLEGTFHGVFTALVTPFDALGKVDWAAYERLLETQLEAGVSGVVPCGTTGEAPTLSAEEKSRLIATAARKCGSKIKVIAGSGSNDTARTIQDSKQALDAGADALLVVTPYYNKPSQAGLHAHYTAVADAVKAPLLIYNVPGRTGVSIAPETVARLALHPHIVGIKEASGNLGALTELKISLVAAGAGSGFALLSGDDPSFWPFLACGGNGVISVASNALPRLLIRLFEYYRSARLNEGLALHEILFPWMNALFLEPNPVPIKTILAWQKGWEAHVRLPLVSLRPETETRLRKTWESLAPRHREDQP